MKKKSFVAMVMLSLALHGNAQKNDNGLLIDSMKSFVTEFFIQKDLLDRHKVNGHLDYVYLTEIENKHQPGYDSNGIYRIGVYQSHSKEYVLIKQKEQFKIFDLEDAVEVLKEVISYSEKNNVSVDSMFHYLKQIMIIYQQNHTTGSRVLKEN